MTVWNCDILPVEALQTNRYPPPSCRKRSIDQFTPQSSSDNKWTVPTIHIHICLHQAAFTYTCL